jgi:hypothetical protein
MNCVGDLVLLQRVELCPVCPTKVALLRSLFCAPGMRQARRCSSHPHHLSKKMKAFVLQKLQNVGWQRIAFEI